MRLRGLFPVVALMVSAGCAQPPESSPRQVHVEPAVEVAPVPVVVSVDGLEQYAIGDWGKRSGVAPRAGTLLMGGGDWVPSAMRWFVEHAGGGRILILRASGDDNLQRQLYEDIGGITAARTLVFSSRSAAFDDGVAEAITQADGIFLAGGDQARYIRFWKDTPVQHLLNAHIQSGKPIAGTSAGLAVLGGWAYGALDDGSIDSPSAMADPLGEAITLERGFLSVPFLGNVVTDTHFAQRDRQGRLLAFVSKARSLSGQSSIYGLGVDEDAALALEGDGKARLHRLDPAHLAWVIAPDRRAGEPVPGEQLQQRDVQIIGINARSELDLATLQVRRPAFRFNAHVDKGQWQIEALQ